MAWNKIQTFDDVTDESYAVAFDREEDAGDYFYERKDSIRLAYGGEDNNVYVRDMSDWSLDATLSQASDNITDIDWSPDGTYLAYTSEDGNCYIHLSGKGSYTYNLQTTITPSDGGHPTCVSFWDQAISSSEEHIAIGSSWETVDIFDMDWTINTSFNENINAVEDIKFVRRGYGYTPYLLWSQGDVLTAEYNGWDDTWEIAYEDKSSNGNAMDAVYHRASDEIYVAFNDEYDHTQGEVRPLFGFDYYDLDKDYSNLVDSTAISWNMAYVAFAGSFSDVYIYYIQGQDHPQVTMLDDPNGTPDISWSFNNNYIAVAEYNAQYSNVYVYEVPTKNHRVEVQTPSGVQGLSLIPEKNMSKFDDDYPLRVMSQDRRTLAETVDTSNADASAVRIQTPDGVKAWKKNV